MPNLGEGLDASALKSPCASVPTIRSDVPKLHASETITGIWWADPSPAFPSPTKLGEVRSLPLLIGRRRNLEPLRSTAVRRRMRQHEFGEPLTVKTESGCKRDSRETSRAKELAS